MPLPQEAAMIKCENRASDEPGYASSPRISRASRVIGVAVIILLWFVCASCLLVATVLCLQYVDAFVIPHDICEDRIEVLAVAAFFFNPQGNEVVSTSYHVRFSSGQTGTISVPGASRLSIGKNYGINYTRSRIFGVIDVLNLEEDNRDRTGIESDSMCR